MSPGRGPVTFSVPGFRPSVGGDRVPGLVSPCELARYITASTLYDYRISRNIRKQGRRERFVISLFRYVDYLFILRSIYMQIIRFM